MIFYKHTHTHKISPGPIINSDWTNKHNWCQRSWWCLIEPSTHFILNLVMLRGFYFLLFNVSSLISIQMWQQPVFPMTCQWLKLFLSVIVTVTWQYYFIVIISSTVRWSRLLKMLVLWSFCPSLALCHCIWIQLFIFAVLKLLCETHFRFKEILKWHACILYLHLHLCLYIIV